MTMTMITKKTMSRKMLMMICQTIMMMTMIMSWSGRFWTRMKDFSIREAVKKEESI